MEQEEKGSKLQNVSNDPSEKREKKEDFKHLKNIPRILSTPIDLGSFMSKGPYIQDLRSDVFY